MIGRRLIAALLAIGCSTAATAREGFLDVRGKEIVDGTGKPVILRAMGLGGWMLEEGYMLNLGELGQQHVIHRKLAALAGQDAVDQFQQAWLDNHMTRADMDALGRWGFNAVRLPMHHALFLDTDAPAGQDRWREDGFRRVDRLLEWAAANRMWVILDLHAAPGGQGTDLAISDRDPSKPSLWDSAENQRRTVALWRELARRYANNPWVGGYDILNEPNWDSDGPGGEHGCEDKRNAPITALYKRITTAIREHDRDHLIVIEGNCWGNNYAGITPDWDGKLVLSFHKYWNRNDDASIDGILKLRETTGRPIWLGESGENSNAWYRDAIKRVERHNIGWAWWPLKKLGFNNPLEVVPNPGWKRVVAYLTGKGPKPTAREARAAMMTLANHDIVYASNIVHPDVIDAMFRQPHDNRAIAFKPHRLRAAPLTIAAVDYDLGPPGVAYFDKVDANYHVATGGERVEWNDGRTYRNDGVDITRDADGRPYVTAFEAGEWMQYTINADRKAKRIVSFDLRTDAPAQLTLGIGGKTTLPLNVAQKNGWQTLTLPPMFFRSGDNRLKITVVRGKVQLRTISVR